MKQSIKINFNHEGVIEHMEIIQTLGGDKGVEIEEAR